MNKLSSEMFEQKFCNRLQKIAREQVLFDKQNIYNPLLRNEYKQFLEFCILHKSSIMRNENLLSTVLALLKYNHKYITDADTWEAKFN